MRNAAIAIALALSTTSLGAATKDAAKAKPKDVAAEINTPRPDARKVAFETREGTWMSLDVSPDGRTIVFDLLGDLYSLPVAGGTATALTRGPAWDEQPRFSPDGRTIVFSSDRGGIENAWLMDADGKNPRALTSEKDAYVRSPAWTPDGQYVIARHEEGKRGGIPPVELWMYHREGGSGIKLTSGDEVNNASGAVASRDGRYIYFAARGKFSYTPDISKGLWQVSRYDRTTGEVLPLTGGYGGAARPALSPDGRWMTFVSRRDEDTVLVRRDLASGAEKILVRGLSHDESEGFAQMDVYPAYAFAEDGRVLVYWNRGKLWRLPVDGGTPQEIPFTAAVEQWVAPRVTFPERVETGPVHARILRWPTQSPDGKWIVFDAFGRVWLQEIDGAKAVGAPRRLTPDDPSLPAREYAPSVSPDGRWIAYVSWSDAEGGHVWKAPVTGGGAPVRLTRSAGHYANPAWSPQGDRLSLVRGSGLEFRGRLPEDEDFFEIHWIEATGGDTHLVTTVKIANSTRFHPQATWSADGQRLFFRDPVEQKKPTDDPKNDLASVRLDGTDRRAHLRLPAVGEIVPSPDGRWVAFTSRDNVYVAAVPPLQLKEPAEVSIKEGAVPVWRLSGESGSWVGWTDGGKTLTWGLANTFRRLPLESAVAFAQEQRRKAEEKEKDKKTAAGGKETGAAAKPAGAPAADEDDLKLPPSQTVVIGLTVPREVPEGAVVLEHARVITMKGGEVLEDADVVVTGNRITSVGPHGKAVVAPDARRLDATGKTVIPGFIDTHAHLHYSNFEVFPELKWEYAANLAYGVTTVYDPSAPSLDVFAQGEMVEAGLMIGPRIYSSGDVLYGGQQEDIWAQVDTLADARRQVARMKAYGARMIKVYQQPRRSQRLYFAEACRQLKMLLTAEGAGELNTDLSMVLDGFTAFEHSLPVELHKDVVQLLAQSGTYYTPTLLVSYGGPWGELYFWQARNAHDDPKLNRFTPHRILDPLGRRHPFIPVEDYQFPLVARGAADVMHAGGHVSLGAHGQVQGLGPHWEIWAMAGENNAPGKALTPLEALRASTLDAADKIGFAADLGSVEPGKLADLIVLDADPLADIHNTAKIRWVVKNGAVYDGETLSQIAPHERPLPTFFWQAAN